MHTVAELLDAARTASGVPSDRQLAFAMEVQPKDVSAWRNGHLAPSERLCFRLAKLAKLPGWYVYACVRMHTAKSDTVRAGWEEEARNWDLKTA